MSECEARQERFAVELTTRERQSHVRTSRCRHLRAAANADRPLRRRARGQRAAGLAALVIAEIVGRTGIDPQRIDEVILGHAYPTSDAPAIGRVAALDAGLPDSVTGIQVDRRCGSGRPAVLDAAMQIRSGWAIRASRAGWTS